MHLTLRTLLAYLDDTMDPAEIKEFGKRVAESDAAQELITRIRQITRRRRLTAPPNTGPGAFDPNTVAEYLDNELTSDQVEKVEKTCLESDVHLAEIAAAHQILTLVLGQPALVPPTASERMYTLVHGREAIPFRKASARSPEGNLGGDLDNEPPSGLPFGKSRPWLRWAIPLAGLFLLFVVGFFLMRDMQSPRRTRQVASNDKPEDPEKDHKATPPDKGTTPPEKGTTTPEKGTTTPEKGTTTPEKGTTTPEKGTTTPEKGTTTPEKGTPPNPNPVQVSKRPEPANPERTDIGVYEAVPKTPSILVQRRPEGWKRLLPSATVFTREPLISLPGFPSEVRLNSGVRLLLRGNTPEFSQHPLMDFLLDSAVILHKNPDFDADLTLLRGRLYISASKPESKVRLRFNDEVWDLTLKDAGTEVGFDLLRQFTRDSNWRAAEEPRTEMYLCVLQGKASLKMDTYFYNDLEAPPGSAVFLWDNEGPRPAGPQRIDKVPPIWSKDLAITSWKSELRNLQEEMQKLSPDKARDMGAYLQYLTGRVKGGEAMQTALDQLSKSMADKVNVALIEGSQLSKDLGLRLLCIYAMSAIETSFKLTDKSLASLRAAGAPETLLAKLNTLQDKTFERQQFLTELARLADKDELERFRNVLLSSTVIDDVGRLFDILASESPAAAPDRDGAIFALRRWISRDANQGKLLYQDDKKTGLLVGTRFTPREADIILTLLHDFPSAQRTKETFELLVQYLSHDKLAIRELARWHLLRLAQGAPKIPPYDAAWPPEQRAAAVKEWEKLVETGALPPRQAEPPPMPK